MFLGLWALVPLAGCKQWPNTAQFQQSQVDNDRLLSELRAHKKRAEDLQLRNEQLAQRLDESERLLAKSQTYRPANRISSTESTFGRPTTSTFGPTSDYSSASRDPKSLEPRTSSSGTGSNRDSSEPPKWRPARKN